MSPFSEEGLPKLSPGKEWLPVHRGESGDPVYRRSDGAAYAKLSKGDGGIRLDAERRRTEWLSTTGVACPAVLDWAESEQGACLVTSALPGVPASELSASALKKAWPSIVHLVKTLHDLPANSCPFERGLAVMYDRAQGVVARGAVNPDFLAPDDRRIAPATLLGKLEEQMPQRLAQEPGDLVVCHGDACLPNFIVAPDTLRCTGLIDLGRLGIADRYVDFSLLLGNAEGRWTSSAETHAANARLFAVHAIARPDRERLDFYLRLDPLTWG